MIMQFKRHYLFLLLCFIAVMAVSCGRPPADEPPVEYGATLDEWEEAMQTPAAEAAVAEIIEPTLASLAIPPTAETNDAPLVITAESTTAPVEADAPTDNSSTTTVYGGITYQEIMWEALIPPDYTPQAIMEKYAEELAKFEDGSADANEIYRQMLEEFNNAPVNETVDQSYIKLPGFIAPLEYSGELITEFLLVPYFGACIHVPPPPVNQTVLVKTAEGQGIDPLDSYDPIWVIGKITAEGTVTDLANAGYYVQDALIEPYSMP